MISVDELHSLEAIPVKFALFKVTATNSAWDGINID